MNVIHMNSESESAVNITFCMVMKCTAVPENAADLLGHQARAKIWFCRFTQNQLKIALSNLLFETLNYALQWRIRCKSSVEHNWSNQSHKFEEDRTASRPSFQSQKPINGEFPDQKLSIKLSRMNFRIFADEILTSDLDMWDRDLTLPRRSAGRIWRETLKV